MVILTPSATNRFWLKTEKAEHGCWTWRGATYRTGYGALSIGRRMVRAHRVSWTIAHGPIPRGLHVLHRCDVRICVRPDHLFLGTIIDNNLDKLAKGRQAKGESMATSKLGRADVESIKRRLVAGEGQSALAREFGVWISTIHMIARGKSWRHVPWPNRTSV